MVDNSQVFIDPYNSQAKRDYYQLITGVIRRHGVLFDYVRYPRGLGSGSIVNKVQDLWIYSNAAKQALSTCAQQGLELIRRFLGRICDGGRCKAVDKLYPGKKNCWQAASAPPLSPSSPLQQPNDNRRCNQVVAVKRCPCSQRYLRLYNGGSFASSSKERGRSVF